MAVGSQSGSRLGSVVSLFAQGDQVLWKGTYMYFYFDTVKLGGSHVKQDSVIIETVLCTVY